MAKATNLWDSDFFGQLQNQAYGYFFPMGPFFWVLEQLHLPAWARIGLWNAFLLNAAFLGTFLVAQRLVRLGPNAALFAGLAYALSPRMVTMIGPVSSEVMPMAALPWILLPLCARKLRDRPLLGAMLSALAVALAGGVNAVATLAVLIVPGLYLVTRQRTWKNVTRLAVWAASVVVVCFWWAGPLLLLGKYSPPFLDWIESSAVTTGVTNSVNVVRGTSQWAAFIAGSGGPSWPAGHFLATASVSVAATLIVAALALIGLVWLKTPEKPFVVLCCVVGFVCVSVGHVHSLNAATAEPLRSWLDHGGAPFRNVHKFDPVLRLPLCLGLGALWVNTWPPAARTVWRHVLTGRLTPQHSTHALAVIAVAATALPFVAGGAAARGGFTKIPHSWQQAGDYLSQYPNQRALVVPSSPFGSYVWGFPRDEPFQVVAQSPWAVRDVVPLSSAGNIRLLDAVDGVLASGRGHEGLAAALAASGTSRLVVRNDLAWKNAQLTRPEVVRATLAASVGIEFAAGFGRPTDVDSEVFANLPTQQKLYPVEIWQVTQPAPRAQAYLAKHTLSGAAAETKVISASSNWVRSRPLITSSANTALVTDTNQRREHYFPRTTKAYGSVLAADQPFQESRAAHDYRPPELAALAQTTSQLTGVRAVTASSSAAQVNAFFLRDRSATPAAALDGDTASRWLSGGVSGPLRQWWQVDFDKPTTVPAFTIQWADPRQSQVRNLVLPTKVTIVTNHAKHRATVDQQSAQTKVDLGKKPISSLRIVIDEAVQSAAQHLVGIRELSIPAKARSGLVIPPHKTLTPHSTSTVVSLHADIGGVAGCTEVEQKPLCDASIQDPGSETVHFDRTFTTSQKTSAPAQGSAIVTNPHALSRHVYPKAATVVSAVSSTASQHPWVSGAAAVDGTPNTAWMPAANDDKPTITLTLPKPQKVTTIELLTRRTPEAAAGTAAALDVQPAIATITTDTGQSQETPISNGRADVEFSKPVKELTVSITAGRVLSPDTKPVNAFGRPFHLSEIKVFDQKQDVTPRVDSPQTITLGCDAGLDVTVDGKAYRYGITAPTWQLLGGQKVHISWCTQQPPSLASGEHVVSSTRHLGVSLAEITWVPAATTVQRKKTGAESSQAQPSTSESSKAGVAETKNQATSLTVPMNIKTWSATRREIELKAPADSGEVILKVAENRNAGWAARTSDGQELAPVLVDGWAQGWIVPAGTSGTVTLVFEPATAYRLFLTSGGLAVLVFALVCLVLSLRRHTAGEGEEPLASGGHSRSDIDRLSAICLVLTVVVVGVGLILNWVAALVCAVAMGGVVLLGKSAPLARSATTQQHESPQHGAQQAASQPALLIGWVYARWQLVVTSCVVAAFGAVTIALLVSSFSVAAVSLWAHLVITLSVFLVAASDGVSQLHRWTFHKNVEAIGRQDGHHTHDGQNWHETASKDG